MADPNSGNAYDEQELRRALFDDAAVAAVHNAEAEAKQRNQYGFDAQFLLLGLLHDQEGLAAQIVQRLGERPEQLELAVRMLVDNSSATPAIRGSDEASASPTFWLTPEASQVFRIATDEAMRVYTNPRRLGPEHLFLGIIRLDSDNLGSVLKQAGITLERARRARDEVLGQSPR